MSIYAEREFYETEAEWKAAIRAEERMERWLAEAQAERKNMKKYKIHVYLEAEYDDIEAEDEDEAFIIASDMAMEGGDWSYNIEEVSESEADEDEG